MSPDERAAKHREINQRPVRCPQCGGVVQAGNLARHRRRLCRQFRARNCPPRVDWSVRSEEAGLARRGPHVLEHVRAADPAGTLPRTTEPAVIVPPNKAVEMAAFLVNAAHDQLAHARRSLYTALDQRSSTPGRKSGQCGTPAGYRRHQRADQTPCWACVDANNWAKRRQVGGAA